MKNRKLLFISFLLLICLIFTGCEMATPSTEGVKKISLEESYFPSEVVVGTFDASKCKIRVHYTDGTTSLEKCTISEADQALFNEVGTHAIKVTYLSYKLTYNVTVMEKPAEKQPIDYINDAIASIDIPSEVSMNFSLPTLLKGVSISWGSNSQYISVSGKNATVTRPENGLGDKYATLTADLTYAGVTHSVDYVIKVLESTVVLPTPAEIIAGAKSKINVLGEVTTDFSVLTTVEGVSVKWSSSNSSYLIVNGGTIKVVRPTDKNVTVTLTATFSYLGETDTETYQVTVIKKEEVVESLYNGTYYNGINLDAAKAVLKSSLRTLISNQKASSYSGLKTIFPKSDASLTDSSKMILFYSGLEVPATWNGNIMNREHVWPKSLGWFNESGAGSDAHHIRPTDPTVNSTRGNIKFGNVNGGTPAYTNAENGRIDSGCRYGGGYFEPRDDVKGDVARIIFYLMIAYSNADSYSFTSVSSGVKVLLEWHEADPVDAWEMNRNNVVETFQKNRNPFIDYPHLANVLFG
ncbi:MAG: endonuclease [Bacilli bacterium]|nr:endonuclease [Bacilli bacterium]